VLQVLEEWEKMKRPRYIPAHEPDEYEFEHAGFKCEMKRTSSHAWCGYAMLPENHPYNGLDMFDDKANSLDVHGGITFAERVRGKGFTLGFDCAHYGDKTSFNPNNHYAMYRTFEYAKAETMKLAEQLREVADASS
jgi:hypothetical protein